MQIAAEFVTSAAGAGDFPHERLPEVALVGRSNVGKSSLINALVRKPIARTSAAPGKTRLANFYRVQRGSAPALFLVDLPGYGYARGGDASAREFQQLTDAYFGRAKAQDSGLGGRDSGLGGRGSGLGARDSGRGAHGRDAEYGISGAAPLIPSPRVPIGVLLLVDSRHPGLESDVEAWKWLKTQPCPSGVIGTKVDKLTRAERARHARELQTLFELPVPLVSAHTGEGLDELWKMIASLPSRTAA